MMRGEKVVLRARREDDVQRLYDELQADVATKSRADTRPWVPVPRERSVYAREASDGAACFSVVEPAPAGEDGERLVGEAVLWGLDNHNRSAHLGVALFPAARGRGLGTDTVRVLCEYGFLVRGLRRLQMETLADNAGMLAAAARAGFTREGRLRAAAWAYGEWADEVVLGLLDEEWRAAR